MIKRLTSIVTAFFCGASMLVCDIPTDGLKTYAIDRCYELTYDGGTEGFDHELHYYLDDNYSCTYSPTLARLLVTLAAGAYDQATTTQNFKTLGFADEDFVQNGYDEEGTDPDNIGYTIGSRTEPDGTVDCLIVIRGTKTASFGSGVTDIEFEHEWVSDLNFGLSDLTEEGGYHKGFKIAAEEILKNIPTSKKYDRYIITGHSRGAAVGNLVAEYLTDSDNSRRDNYRKSSVYAYNFAVPDVAYLKVEDFIGADGTAYENIFNFSNAMDPVSLVPSESKLAEDLIEKYADSWNKLSPFFNTSTMKTTNKIWRKFGTQMWFSDEGWDNYYQTSPLSGKAVGSVSAAGLLAGVVTYHDPNRYVAYFHNEPDYFQFRNKEGLYWDKEHTILDHLDYSLVDGTVTITRCDNKLRDVEIPSKIEKKRVTDISGKAFQECYGLHSVVLPETLLEFHGSGGNHWNEWDEPGGSFSYCRRLENVNIPSSLAYLPQYMFYGCKSLKTIEIPDTITKIGGCAFAGCDSLTNMMIPDSVTEIDDSAFSGCSNLESISLSKKLTTVGTRAFSGCISLEEIILPDSIKSFKRYGMKQIHYADTFEGCTNLTHVKLPCSLERIEERMFEDCTFLTDIEIPDTVKSIGESAFANCRYLTGITLPEGLETVGKYAFSNCSTKFRSVTIPSTVASIGEHAFGYSNNGKMGDFTIYGYTGTEAEKYASNNEFTFVLLGNAPKEHEEPSTGVIPTETTPTGVTPTETTPTESKADETKTTEQKPSDTTPTETTGTASLYGDIDESGKVDILDVIKLNKNLLGVGEISSQGKINADVDRNGSVDATDSLNILKAVIEMVTLPIV